MTTFRILSSFLPTCPACIVIASPPNLSARSIVSHICLIDSSLIPLFKLAKFISTLGPCKYNFIPFLSKSLIISGCFNKLYEI